MAEQGCDAADSRLSWTVCPLIQDPLRAAGLGLLVVGFSAYCLYAFNHWLYAAGALVILGLGAHSSLLPSTYTVGDNGIGLKRLFTTRLILWNDLACYLRTDDFIALSVASPPTHRSISDGMVVRLAGNGDEVEAAIAAHIPQCPRPSEPAEAE